MIFINKDNSYGMSQSSIFEVYFICFSVDYLIVRAHEWYMHFHLESVKLLILSYNNTVVYLQ